MTAPSVLLDIAPSGIATIAFNRAELHNAIDETTIAEFREGLERVAADASVRALIVAGNGKSFCAGADLNWMQRTAAYDEEQNYRDACTFTALLARLDGLPVPTIARVHGAAYGGGVGIVAACDIAIGAPQAVFMFSEVRLGIVPAMISPYAIAAIGARQARRYMLSAERIDAAEALRIGLLHDVCEAQDLDARIAALVGELARGGPAAIAACKALIAGVAQRPLDGAVREETARAIAAIRASDEGREGIGAFLQKRTPAWIRAAKQGAKR